MIDSELYTVDILSHTYVVLLGKEHVGKDGQVNIKMVRSTPIYMYLRASLETFDLTVHSSWLK